MHPTNAHIFHQYSDVVIRYLPMCRCQQSKSLSTATAFTMSSIKEPKSGAVCCLARQGSPCQMQLLCTQAVQRRLSHDFVRQDCRFHLVEWSCTLKSSKKQRLWATAGGSMCLALLAESYHIQHAALITLSPVCNLFVCSRAWAASLT